MDAPPPISRYSTAQRPFAILCVLASWREIVPLRPIGVRLKPSFPPSLGLPATSGHDSESSLHPDIGPIRTNSCNLEKVALHFRSPISRYSIAQRDSSRPFAAKCVSARDGCLENPAKTMPPAH